MNRLSLSLSLLLFPLAAPAADFFLLENFDGDGVWDVHFPNEPQMLDVDGNNDKEGLFASRGFKTIMVFKVLRNGEIAEALQKHSALVFDVVAVPGRNKGTFLQNLVMIQTDVDGKAIYEILQRDKVMIDKGGKPVTARFELLDNRTSDTIPNLGEALQRFLDGEGKFFNIAIVQQTSNEDTSLCVYDDIRLE